MTRIDAARNPAAVARTPGDDGRADDQLEPALAQVAFSVVDLAATERWFREGLGFWPAGGSRRLMRGPLASSVQGLPRVASTCWWMVDRNEFFQLEMFQFERPLARLMPHDARPCDIGYARIGVWVADFDETLTRLARLGSRAAQRPDRARRRAPRVRAQPRRRVRRDHGGRPARRRLDPPREDRPARSRVRSVTLSVPDLARSEAFFSPRARPSALRCRAASARARSALGPCGRAHAQQRVRRRRRPRRTGAVPRSGRTAAPDRPPDLGSRHPEHRLRGASPIAITASSTTRDARPERGRTAGRFTCRGPASST